MCSTSPPRYLSPGPHGISQHRHRLPIQRHGHLLPNQRAVALVLRVDEDGHTGCQQFWAGGGNEATARHPRAGRAASQIRWCAADRSARPGRWQCGTQDTRWLAHACDKPVLCDTGRERTFARCGASVRRWCGRCSANRSKGPGAATGYDSPARFFANLKALLNKRLSSNLRGADAQTFLDQALGRQPLSSKPIG
jgi:hypothetical protein